MILRSIECDIKEKNDKNRYQTFVTLRTINQDDKFNK